MIIQEPGRFTCGICGYRMWMEGQWRAPDPTAKIRCLNKECSQHGFISEVKLPIAEVVNVVPAQDPSGG